MSIASRGRHRPWAALGIAVAILSGTAARARPKEVSMRRASLSLPAPPATLVPADLDGDGRTDLLAIVAYTAWGGISTDRVEDAVQVTEVVPALYDRREARAFLAQPDGTYRESGPPLPLPFSVLAVEAGPRPLPVVALDDDGVFVFRLTRDESGPKLTLDPWIRDRCVLAGSGRFHPSLRLMRDVDADGKPDYLFPAEDGIAIYRGTDEGFAKAPATRLRLPGDRVDHLRRRYPLPEVQDVDGDRVPDLVVTCLECASQEIWVIRGLGGGRFAEPRRVGTGCAGLGSVRSAGGRDRKKEGPRGGNDDAERRIDLFGDLDGDGRADVVTRQYVDTGKSDLKQAKRPRSRYRLHHLSPDLAVESEPYQTLEADGYATSGEIEDRSEADFKDLDGDGKQDLITVTLDFSLLQALRVLTTKKISIELEFQVYCAGPDGKLTRVPDQVLKEKLRFDLNQLEIGRLAEFRGDFDGDGRVDFLRLGGGKEIDVHLGRPGCRYAEQPDLRIPLDEAPDDVMLIRVQDLDGDGRSDVALTRPQPAADEQASAPARVELLLSGEAR